MILIVPSGTSINPHNVVVVAIVVAIGLQFAGKDRAVTPTSHSVTSRRHLWMAGCAGGFVLGLAVLAIDGDNELWIASRSPPSELSSVSSP